LDALKTLQTSELGSFLTVMDAGHIHGKEASSTKVDGLASLFANEDERVIAQCIGEAIVDRAALLSTVNLASIALKTHKGQSAARPILTTADGTTFYELPGLRQKTLKYLDDFLTGTHGQHMEFARVDNAPLIGRGDRWTFPRVTLSAIAILEKDKRLSSKAWQTEKERRK